MGFVKYGTERHFIKIQRTRLEDKVFAFVETVLQGADYVGKAIDEEEAV